MSKKIYVVCIGVNEDLHVLAHRKVKGPAGGAVGWNGAGGGVKQGEHPGAAASREWDEEVVGFHFNGDAAWMHCGTHEFEECNVAFYCAAIIRREDVPVMLIDQLPAEFLDPLEKWDGDEANWFRARAIEAIALIGRHMGWGPQLKGVVEVSTPHQTATLHGAEVVETAEGLLVKGTHRPNVVCLCGSTRYRKEFEDTNRDLTLDGNIVLTVGNFSHAELALSTASKEALDALHLRKIEMADEVFVVNPTGYAGHSTLREIAHAERLGKRVTFMAPLHYGDPG